MSSGLVVVVPYGGRPHRMVVLPRLEDALVDDGGGGCPAHATALAAVDVQDVPGRMDLILVTLIDDDLHPMDVGLLAAEGEPSTTCLQVEKCAFNKIQK